MLDDDDDGDGDGDDDDDGTTCEPSIGWVRQSRNIS